MTTATSTPDPTATSAPPSTPNPRPLVIEDINRTRIARYVNVNVSHISRIFSGERKPSITMSNLICESLSEDLGWEVTLDDLFDLLVTINPGILHQPSYKQKPGTRSGRVDTGGREI